MKKLFAILLISVFAVTILTACGGSKQEETPAPAETQAPTAPAEEKKEMDTGDLVSRIFDDMGIEMIQADDIYMELIDADGNRTVTFTVGGQKCTYVINAYDGTIVSKDIPDGVLESANAAGDPVETAINACFNSIEGYHGGAENISVSMEGTIINVEFDYNGEHYSRQFDTSAGKLID